MKALLQRVSSASVSVAGNKVAAIGDGILVFLGVVKGDVEKDSSWLAHKIVSYRLFPDEHSSFSVAIRDCGGEILVISQFTLAARSKKGNRPDFSQAEIPVRAEALYLHFIDELKELHPHVKTGMFGANMQVELVNDGPVTILLSSS